MVTTDITTVPPQISVSSANVQVVSRDGNPDSADLCTVQIDTSWFAMTNSYHQLKEDVQIMTQFDRGVHKPVVSFVRPDFESCYSYPGCRRDLQLAQEIVAGFDSIYQDFDFVFHTESRNDYCQFLRDSSNPTWSSFPSATSYAAYLQKYGLLDKLYVHSDRNVFGSSRRMFLPLDWSSMPNPVLRMRELQNQNETNDRDFPDHSPSCSSQRTIDQCLSLPECSWRDAQHSCYAKPNKPIGVQRGEEEADRRPRPTWVGIVSAILIVCGSVAVILLLVVGGRRASQSTTQGPQDHDESLIPLAAQGSGASDSRLGSSSLETIDLDPLYFMT